MKENTEQLRLTLLKWILSIIGGAIIVAAILGAFYGIAMFFFWVPGQAIVIAIFAGLVFIYASEIKRDWFP